MKKSLALLSIEEGNGMMLLPSTIDLRSSQLLKWINDELIYLAIDSKPFISNLESQFKSKQEELKKLLKSQAIKN